VAGGEREQQRNEGAHCSLATVTLSLTGNLDVETRNLRRALQQPAPGSIEARESNRSRMEVS